MVQSQRFMKTKYSHDFLQKDQIQGSTMQLLKTLKPVKLAWPVRKQPSNLWMLLRVFCFHKTLWLDSLPPSVPVWVSDCNGIMNKSKWNSPRFTLNSLRSISSLAMFIKTRNNSIFRCSPHSELFKNSTPRWWSYRTIRRPQNSSNYEP